MDSAIIGLIAALIALVIFDLLALRYGADSRTTSRRNWW